MTSIGDSNAVAGAPLTPQQQVEASLVGTPGSISGGETAQESADSALLDLTTGSSGVAADLQANVPADLTAASSLVSDLASQISQSGSGASDVYALLSADATFKLTKA